MIPRMFLAFACIATLCGCRSLTVWSDGTRTGPKLPPVPAGSVQVLNEKPQRPNYQVGLVSAIGAYWAMESQLVHAMQKEAGKLGAAAIVHSNPGEAGGMYPRTNATAIQWK